MSRIKGKVEQQTTCTAREPIRMECRTPTRASLWMPSSMTSSRQCKSIDKNSSLAKNIFDASTSRVPVCQRKIWNDNRNKQEYSMDRLYSNTRSRSREILSADADRNRNGTPHAPAGRWEDSIYIDRCVHRNSTRIPSPNDYSTRFVIGGEVPVAITWLASATERFSTLFNLIITRTCLSSQTLRISVCPNRC